MGDFLVGRSEVNVLRHLRWDLKGNPVALGALAAGIFVFFDETENLYPNRELWITPYSQSGMKWYIIVSMWD